MDMIAVVPTFRRPEMLALTLQNLRRAVKFANKDVSVYIFADYHPESDLRQALRYDINWVRDNYFPEALLSFREPHIETPGGTYNILMSLLFGHYSFRDPDLVCLVEEDVLVSDNFFVEHERLHRLDDYFVTSGRVYKHFGRDKYTNPGSCFRRDFLASLVRHINDDYFTDCQSYVEKHFPEMDDAGVLDDGLIRRVARSLNAKALCADPSIAAHIGFHAYQRFARYFNEGTIQERIAWIKDFITDIPRRKQDPNLRDLEELVETSVCPSLSNDRKNF